MKESSYNTSSTSSRKYSQESYHPYSYSRQSSISPGYSTSYSPITPIPTPQYSKTTTTNQNCQLTDRLRQYLPEIPKDQLSYQILLQTISHVVELEQQLESLEAETRKLRHLQYTNCRQFSTSPSSTSSSPPSFQNQEADRIVPADLANVDVSEFKHLVLSSPLEYPNFGYSILEL